MESAEKRDHVLPSGVIASQFKRAFNGFRAGVSVVNLVRAGHGSNLREALRQGDHILVIKIRARHVNQFSGLFLNGRDHMRMTMSRRGDSYAGGKIEELVSVHVGDNNSAALLRNQRVRARVRRRDVLIITFENLLGFGPGERGFDLGTGSERLGRHGDPPKNSCQFWVLSSQMWEDRRISRCRRGWGGLAQAANWKSGSRKQYSWLLRVA